MDNVLLYEKVKGTYYKIGYGGDRNQKFYHRTYKNRRFIFPLNNHKALTHYFLMIDKRNASVNFPLYLWNKDYFEVEESKQNIYYGFFFGILFFVSIISFFIGVILPNRLFVYYGLYAFFMVLYLFTALGFSYEYLYPNAKHFNNYSRIILMVLITTTATKFLKMFLDVKDYSPKINRYFAFCNYVLLGLTVGWWLFAELYKTYTIILLNIAYIIILSVFIMAFIAAYRVLKYKFLNAIIFFIAFSFIILGAAFYVGIEYGVINESFFPLNPILLGSGLEIIILSIVMIYQFITIYKHKNEVEKEKDILEIKNTELKQNSIKLKELINKKTKINKPLILKSKAKLKVTDIVYIKSDGPYLEFYLHLKQRPEIERNTMKWVLSVLPKTNFVQIHRSYIINTDYVKIIKASQVVLKDGTSLKISRSHKAHIKTVFMDEAQNIN